jgi:hypothetical protein
MLQEKQEIKQRPANRRFAKKRVQCLIEHSTSHQNLWYVDSLVLRNPLLRQSAKRYQQAYRHTKKKNNDNTNRKYKPNR